MGITWKCTVICFVQFFDYGSMRSQVWTSSVLRFLVGQIVNLFGSVLDDFEFVTHIRRFEDFCSLEDIAIDRSLTVVCCIYLESR